MPKYHVKLVVPYELRLNEIEAESESEALKKASRIWTKMGGTDAEIPEELRDAVRGVEACEGVPLTANVAKVFENDDGVPHEYGTDYYTDDNDRWQRE